MGMIKKGIAFENAVVDVIDEQEVSCSQCDETLNLMTSSNGLIDCQKCGHKNAVPNLEN